jgi:hypothetical protein
MHATHLAPVRRRSTWAGAAALVSVLAVSGAAQAAPAGGSASARVGTGGNSGSAKGKSGGYKWPEVVVAGNAISFLAPLQFGLVNYLPKARFAFQYDRQIRKGHWFHVGIGALFDRGNYKNFRMKDCGLGNAEGVCDKGGVVGVDVYAGYTYKFYLDKRPWLVPFVRGSVGYTYFDLPKVGGGSGNREQSRVHSQGMTIRPGGGLRLFPLDQLGVGIDVGLPLGFLVHQVRNEDGEEGRTSSFLLGIEVLPLVVEYRF